MRFASERSKTVKYAIRDLIPLASELEKKGKKIIRLNIGDPAQFDFEPPDHLKKALSDAVMEGGYNCYSDSQGLLELRESICHKELGGGVSLSPENIVVTNGISEGITLTTGSLCDPGSNLLIPGPVYPPYPVFVRYYGAEVNFYKCDEENGWQPDTDDIRSRVTDRTKGILLVNPNNPTGAVYKEKILREIVDIAGEFSIPVLSDEIYDRLVFDEKHVSTASLSKDVPVVGFNGFSKGYIVTGWRLGYIYFHDPTEQIQDLRDAIIRTARVRLCASTPAQKAAVAGLEGSQEHIDQMMQKLRPRRDLAYKRLNEIPGLSCTKPEGAFYVFPKILDRKGANDDRKYVINLLEETGVLIIHGSGFGEPGRDHFRMVYLAPMLLLNEALDRISTFMEKVV